MKNSVARTQPEKVYLHQPADDNLPLAIGANFHDDPINRNTLRKSHNLLLPRKVDYAPHTEYNYSGSAMYDGRRTRSAATDDDDDDDEAVWDGWFSEELSERDKRDFVVRMLAYFVEPVPESAVEEERVRTVCIKYFVEDSSVAIVEAKQENSGMVQSTLLSRRRVPKQPETPEDILLLDDFHIGDSVKIYGRCYHLVDMDKRSRRYYAEVRQEDVPASLPIPRDAYTDLVQKSLVKNARLTVTAEDMERRRVAEQQLTGIYTSHAAEDIAITQQFLKHRINEHLTFYALWDDRGSLSGDVHLCVLRIYLENFALEAIESRPANSGYASGPVLLSRQRVPRSGVEWRDGRFQEHTYGKLLKSDYLCPDDLEIGETYTIFGKPFFIFDADAMTRRYFVETVGRALKPAVDAEPFLRNDKKPALFYPPPPNGFGSEREQRDNWLALSAKPPKVDQERLRRESGRVMRFTARLAKPLVPGDEKREFVIAFYRADNAVEIFEKARANSGSLAGRFLAKGPHRKTLPNGTTTPFTADDFAVGREVVIYERPFKLLAMDESTTRIVDGTDNPITDEHIKELVILLKRQMGLKFTRANEAYLALAPQGTLGYRQVQDFLRTCNCDLSDEEALLVVQNLSPGTGGVISYDDFLSLTNLAHETMDEASLTTRSMRNVNMTVNHALKDTANASEDRQRRRHLKTLLQQKLVQRKGSLQEQFRLFSEHSATSRMNRDAFRRSLNEIMHFNVSPKEEDMLVAMLFDGVEDENGDITYKQFQDFVDSA